MDSLGIMVDAEKHAGGAVFFWCFGLFWGIFFA
jgi:hypothetical protein